MILGEIFIFAGHPYEWSITVFDNIEGNGKPIFTFVTHKKQVHFSDTFLTMIIMKNLVEKINEQ